MKMTDSSHTNGEVHYTKDYKTKLLINNVVSIACWLLILAFTIYIGFIMLIAPIATKNGTVYPSHDTPTPNSKVIVLANKDDMIGRVKNALFTNDAQYGHVIVGNYGTLSDAGGKFVVVKDGKPYITTVNYNADHSKYLNNEYIVKLDNGKEVLVSGDFVKDVK